MTRLTMSARVTAADTESRTIAGRVVTFGEQGNTSAGPVVFAPGSIAVPEDPGAVRLQREHDHTAPLGRGLAFTESEAGIDGEFRVAATAAGNDALVEAAEGLRDGLSVGVDVKAHSMKGGVMHVTAAELVEVSLVTFPAIASARVEKVAASEQDDPETPEADPAADNPDEEDMDSTAVAEATVVEAAATIAVPAPARTAVRLPSLGEYIAAAANQHRDPEAFLRITAALDEQVLAENPGIVPEPIVGPIVDTLLAQRPFVSAVPNRGMPAGGKIFTRPKVTQHTEVGKQNAELDELASQLMTIDPVSVTKGTYGGALRVSVQDRDFTEPAILALLVNDMVKQYANATDNAAADAFVTAVTEDVTLANNAAADVVIAAIYTAAQEINGSINQLPDTIFASPDQWARLGSLVDTTKRPIFPSLAPNNAPGVLEVGSFTGNPLGLRLVVDANFASGTLIVGRAEYFECWEQAGGQLSVSQPSILGFDLAYYGYFAPVMLEDTAFRVLKPGS